MIEVNDPSEVCSDTLLWLEQMRRLTAIVGKDLREHCQLTLDEYCILALVAQKPQVHKVLACDMQRSFAAVSRCVMVLSRLGLVLSNPGTDVRGCQVSITRRGHNQLKRAREHLTERLHFLGGDLSNVEISILNRVEKNMGRFVSHGKRMF